MKNVRVIIVGTNNDSVHVQSCFTRVNGLVFSSSERGVEGYVNDPMELMQELNKTKGISVFDDQLGRAVIVYGKEGMFDKFTEQAAQKLGF